MLWGSMIIIGLKFLLLRLRTSTLDRTCSSVLFIHHFGSKFGVLDTGIVTTTTRPDGEGILRVQG